MQTNEGPPQPTDAGSQSNLDRSREVSAEAAAGDDANAGDDAKADQAAQSGDDAVAQLRQELAAAQDRLLRCQADFDNFRRRSAKELQDIQQYAPLPLLRDLLNVRDNLERAIDAAEKTQGQAATDQTSLLEGVRLVSTQLAGVFQQHHVQEIRGLGEPFDPQRHEAIGSQPSAEYPSGTISVLVQTGFMLHDRVIRPALVMVSTGPPAAG